MSFDFFTYDDDDEMMVFKCCMLTIYTNEYEQLVNSALKVFRTIE
jgi:hypothetical protein